MSELYVDESKAAEITRALARFLAREIEIPFDLHNDVTTIITAARLYGSHLLRVAACSDEVREIPLPWPPSGREGSR